MPVSGLLFVLLLVPALIPGMEFYAVIVVMVSSLVLKPFASLSQELARLMGVAHLAVWIQFGLLGAAICGAAAFLGVRLLRGNLSPSQEGRYLNSLVIVLGVPLMAAAIWARLASAWHH